MAIQITRGRIGGSDDDGVHRVGSPEHIRGIRVDGVKIRIPLGVPVVIGVSEF